jgi:pre-mRNA-splicing factor 18
MDLLKREMERKRKVLHEAKQKLMAEQSKSSTSNESRQRRYMKTSEVRRILEEEEEESKETKKNDAANQIINDLSRENIYDTKDSKKQKLEHTQALNGATGGDNTTTSLDENDNVKSDKELHKQDIQSAHVKLQYTLEAVQRELRLLGLPITYFGETSVGQRLQRLQHAQTHQSIMQLQEREADEFRLKQGFGIRNTFLEKDDMNDAMKLTAAEFQDEANKSSHDQDRNTKSKKHNEILDVGSSLTNTDDNGNNHDRVVTTTEMEEDDDKHKRIYKHFKGLLKQWENDLNQRSDEMKRTLAGRNETKKVKQCKDYIRPLFQLCKRRQLDENMVEKLYAMVLFCEQGEFVRAHDAYMDIAIGRAAWPIGVTMVGIHARTGRAKIESSNVAHVMNSELQRKYLTSVKRLLTYEQNQRTDVDPSKKVR